MLEIGCLCPVLELKAIDPPELAGVKSRWGEKNRQKLAMFLAPFTILPFDDEDSMVAGRIGALEQRGMPIGPYDVQIAAQTPAKGLIVLTHNISQFQRVPDLRVEDWVE